MDHSDHSENVRARTRALFPLLRARCAIFGMSRRNRRTRASSFLSHSLSREESSVRSAANGTHFPRGKVCRRHLSSRLVHRGPIHIYLADAYTFSEIQVSMIYGDGAAFGGDSRRKQKPTSQHQPLASEVLLDYRG